jgi:hypothetical protein
LRRRDFLEIKAPREHEGGEKGKPFCIRWPFQFAEVKAPKQIDIAVFWIVNGHYHFVESFEKIPLSKHGLVETNGGFTRSFIPYLPESANIAAGSSAYKADG